MASPIDRRSFLTHSAAGALLAAMPAMPTAAAATTDRFLSGGYAPVTDEVTLDDLPVTGRIPAELAGVYRRNGPNPAFPPLSYTYPFDGDGMVHALAIGGGKASYRNRFVLTPQLKAERLAGRALYGGIMRPVAPDPALLPAGTPPGPFKNFANTNIVAHGGRLLALYEAALPQEMSAELETKGAYDFAGALKGAMTAHPFIDPVNGEMVFYRYRVATAPYLTVFVADRAGRVVAERDIDTGVPYMIHDFVATERHIVFVLAPVVFDLAARRQGKPVLQWQPERGTRIAVLDRRAIDGPVAWLDAGPFFLYHFMNAHDDRDAIVIDYARYAAFGMIGENDPPRLARMTIAGRSIEHSVTTPVVEFPRVDDRRRGRAHRWGYALRMAPRGHGAIAAFDRRTDSVAVHDFGPGKEAGEPVFAPRPGGTGEQDGWVMTFVYDRAADRSDFVVLDARDIAARPVATVHLPRRVPHGLHGNWMAA